jgi:hypothetical protein
MAVLTVATALLTIGAGVGGYAAGAGRSDPGTPPDLRSAPTPTRAAGTTANRLRFNADLAPYAEPLYATLQDCRLSAEESGPRLEERETQHVRCRVYGVAVHYTTYRTEADRDGYRSWWKSAYATKGGLAPSGIEPPSRKTGAVSKTAGQYVEYVYPAGKEHVMCGLWWDRDSPGGAVRFEALCDQIGNDWAPLRELWRASS